MTRPALRIYGRPVAKMLEYEQAKARELYELEVDAKPETVRRLAAFFERVAAVMEAKGSSFDHVHLLDAWSAHGEDLPDILVYCSDDDA